MKQKDKEPVISIIIPLYNEEENISVLWEKLQSVINELDKPCEVICVNDGSSDNTYSLLKELADRFSNIKVISFRKNFGQTAALSAGINLAKGEIVIPMDGDLQNDPADIKILLNKIEEGYDVVSGWRKNRKDKRYSRILPSVIANKMISIISGIYLHDYGCTLKAYKRDIIKRVKLYGEMHRFIPIYAAWQGAKVAEVVVTHHPRQFGKSKYGIERTIKVILDLIVIKFLASYSAKPIYVFGGFGIINFFLAFLAGLWAIYLKYFEDTTFIETPLPLLVTMLTLIGLLSILIGLLAEMVMRTYYESQNKDPYIINEILNNKD